MPDREKVIKELEHIAEWLDDCCVYKKKEKAQACRDAIALLKEQETLEMRLQHACECYEELEKEYNKQKQIVLCKECKHGEKSPILQYYPNLTRCNKYKRTNDDNWFCADGERGTE